MTQYIKAPFNFVPLNEKVFFPEWADQVSHDIPFSDGESGEIELELEAMTPIFVRNGHTKEQTDPGHEKYDEYVSFSKDADGNYFIPGTSVKGMVRNVLEIMSFGKMNLDPRMKYATREWDNPKVFDLKQVSEQNKVCCGYLMRENDKVIIENHGKPFRINHRRIGEYLNTSIFKDYFSKQSKQDLNKPIDKLDPKTAKFKYHLLTKNKVDFTLLNRTRFTCDNEYGNKDQLRRLKLDNTGEIKGDIVFTGQPDQWSSDQQAHRERDKGKGKFYEFVFSSSFDKEYPQIDVPELMFKQFEFFNKDSDDWNYWRSDFNKGKKIPIFFRHENGIIKDFGLAFLYKIPFNYSPNDLSKRAQINFDKNKPDLPELIFGFTNKKNEESNKKISVRGRVQFSKFKAPVNTVASSEIKTTLGSPKASYYPLYIDQKNGENGIVPQKTEQRGRKTISYFDYETYHSESAKISGWKRYPVKDSATPRPTENEELDSRFKPLPEGTIFAGKIRFHNLNPLELGALLSALTFHGNADKLYHQIGMGKPQGFGKMKIKGIDIKTSKPENHFLSVFEKEMEKQCADNWLKSDQIKELLTMADDKPSKLNNLSLEYMQMSMTADDNEFAKAKTFGEYLERYTQFSNSKFSPDSITEKIYKEEQESKKQNAKQINQTFNENLSKLEKNIEEKNVNEAGNIISAITQQIEGYELFVDGFKKFKSLEKKFLRLNNYSDLLIDVQDLMSNKQWQQAKIMLLEKVLPFYDGYKTEIEEKIAYCKSLEAESITFNKSIDLSMTIDNNKGKILNYLNKKGKLKQLPEEDLSDFFNALKIWYGNDPKRQKKEWTEFDFNRSIWKNYVAKWVGIDKAKEFFIQLIKN
jgi:CRISPR-associated protein (TIGR03986 family)